MNVAIIPARGGSKRIPGKNIRDFCGRPIIAYSIEAALESGLFHEVMVSTDSEEIAGVAQAYGASIPFMRSAKMSDDYATTADVVLEVLDAYTRKDVTFDCICCIYPTAPFVTKDKLCAAFNALQTQNVDAVIPVVPFSYPPLRGFVIDDNALLKMRWPENLNVRSQDMGKMYHDSGQFYFVRTRAFMEEKALLCKKSIPMILSELEVQDIDNETDWKLAELKYQLISEG